MSGKGWTRRAFFASFAAGAVCGAERKVVRPFPPEPVRYADPATDYPVTRLTSPKHTSILPPAGHRVVSRRGFLFFASDHTGSPQLVQMFLSNGESRQLTDAAALDPRSPALAPDDRSVYFFDGPVLKQLVFATMRELTLYQAPEGWTREGNFALTRDHACLVETQAGRSRLRMIPLRAKASGGPATVFEAPARLRDPLPRPRHGDILYRDEAGFLELVETGASAGRRLALAPGRTGPAFWAPDGESLPYLNFPPASGQLNSIREWSAEGEKDRLVAPTSQYATFAPNSDASVFVGASASKAAPYVLLLLRVTRRELPLCEHRASDPAAVSPVFSPDSQRVFFQSDRDGKPAIYMADVQKLVEKTD